MSALSMASAPKGDEVEHRGNLYVRTSPLKGCLLLRLPWGPVRSPRDWDRPSGGSVRGFVWPLLGLVWSGQIDILDTESTLLKVGAFPG